MGLDSPVSEHRTQVCNQRRRPGGTVPPKFEVGDGPCIGPPIFREVVLLDVCERMNRVKIGFIKEFFFEIVVFVA